jgi:hypothetical protein
MDEVTGDWRKLHNEELHKLYSRRIKWAGLAARIGAKRNVYRMSMGKPEGKRSLERRRRRWVDNIKMDLREIGWGGMDWIHLAQDRDHWRALVNIATNLQGP